MSQNIVFEKLCHPTLSYDKLTQELCKAQSILNVLESITPKSNIHKTMNSNQNHWNNNYSKSIILNLEAQLNIHITRYIFENNKFKADNSTPLMLLKVGLPGAMGSL